MARGVALTNVESMASRRLFSEISQFFLPLARALDTGVVVLAGWLAFVVRTGEWLPWQRYQIALLLGGLVTLLVFPTLDVYRSWRGRRARDQVRRVLGAWLLAAIVLMALGVATKTNMYFSRQWMGLWFLFGALLLVGLRVALTVMLRDARTRGRNHRRVALVGAGPQAATVARRLEAATWTGFEIAAVFAPAGQECPEGSLPVAVQPLAAISEYLDAQPLDEVWFTLAPGAETGIAGVIRQLRNSTLDIRYLPDVEHFGPLNPVVSEIAGMAVLDLDITPMRGINRLVKAIEDRLLAVLLLAFSSPLLMAIAVGVKLSSRGPVIFKQRRNGWDGRPFTVYKFRTMADSCPQRSGVAQATRNDPRGTRFGAFLRRTSLDELPQLFNVLQGRMSVVGPRPHALAHNEHYRSRVQNYMRRHCVKPGITGWAQVNGYRGETDTVEKMARRVEHDLWYIDHWSLWLDLKIIVLTLFRTLGDRNAY